MVLFVSMLLCVAAYHSEAFSLAPPRPPCAPSPLLFSWRHTSRHQHKTSHILYAKKKKKKKGNKNQKKSGFEWASSFTLKPFEAKATRELAASAVASYEGRTGKPLAAELKGVADLPKALWNAPVACVIVSSEGAEEKNAVVVKYANTAALETVGLEPHEFERLIASDDKPASDNVALELNLPTSMKGDKKYESGYSKKMFKDVTILDAQRWSIEKSSMLGGKFVTTTLGVAYAWNEWAIGDGNVICSPGGKKRRQLNVGELEEAIQDKAAAIRELKEGQGLGNKDPQVVEAVQELLELKSMLADAQA